MYTSTNGAAGNAVVAFARMSDGTLAHQGTFPTGGNGIGGVTDPLVSQYAVVLSPDDRFLFVVNAGSNDISTFAVTDEGLALVGKTASGGVRPTSVTSSKDMLYALNAGSGTVSSFHVADDGSLHPQPGGIRALSPGTSGGAAIRLSPNGRLLAVTGRTSNTIDTFGVESDGSLSAPMLSASAGTAPFGFDYTPRGQLLVSEAGTNSASSYRASPTGTLTVISAAVSTEGQRAVCWLIATRDGRFAYTANAATGSISGFAVNGRGHLELLTPGGLTGNSGAGSIPLDLDVTNDSRFLYVFESGSGTIGAFRIGHDGSLTALPDTPGLVANGGYQGLAAF